MAPYKLYGQRELIQSIRSNFFVTMFFSMFLSSAKLLLHLQKWKFATQKWNFLKIKMEKISPKTRKFPF